MSAAEKNGGLRILISRLSHIGDCILTIPMLNALRAHFPQAFITWVVQKPTDQLLSGQLALDELVIVPAGFLKSPGELSKLRRRLRGLRFDVAIDPQALTKSAVVSRLSGARQRISFTRGVARELAPLLNNDLVEPTQEHVVDRQLELLKPLGVNTARTDFTIPANDITREFIDSFISQTHLGCDYAVINPGAGWGSRRWSSERFGRVAKVLGERHRIPTVVTWAGSEEKQWASDIAAYAGGHAMVAPPTSLLQLAELLRRARIFVGCDTGPMHLAVAVDVPCVVLHGTTRPSQSGPYGDKHQAVQAFYQGGSSRSRRSASNDAMRAIEVDDVCAACLKVLQSANTSKLSQIA